jgi:hypothetical protein
MLKIGVFRDVILRREGKYPDISVTLGLPDTVNNFSADKSLTRSTEDSISPPPPKKKLKMILPKSKNMM